MTKSEFCHSAALSPHLRDLIGTFLEVFLGNYSNDRQTSRDVTGVHIELVSAILYGQ